MSADNYLRVVQKGKKYKVVYGCASNDWTTDRGTFSSLEEAVRFAQEIQTNEIIEYGISFSLAEKETTNE